MSDQHALVTGAIAGRIPHGDGFLDVTPDVLTFDTLEEAQAAAESIGVEHAIRGTHPLQAECVNLDDPAAFPDGAPADAVKRHRREHKALNRKAGL
jgi:hypothetical protein